MIRIPGTGRAPMVLTIIVVLGACGGESAGPSAPEPGTLTVELETPNAAEGAMLFRINGPAFDEITAADGSVLVEANVVGTTATVAVFGSFDGGPIARVAVPDTRAAYTVQLQQVAAPDNSLRPALQSYSLKIRQ